MYALDGTDISLAFKLEFFCTNNEIKYGALVIVLILALKMGLQGFRVQGDLKFIIKQVNGEFALKKSALYPTELLSRASQILKSIRFKHTPRAHNRYADALATLA